MGGTDTSAICAGCVRPSWYGHIGNITYVNVDRYRGVLVEVFDIYLNFLTYTFTRCFSVYVSLGNKVFIIID